MIHEEVIELAADIYLMYFVQPGESVDQWVKVVLILKA